MKRCFHSRRVILPDGIAERYVRIAEDKILSVTEAKPEADEYIELGEQYLAPGLIDLHVHGAVGHDFGSCSAAQAAEAIHYHLAHGTTTLLPTLAAAPIEDMAEALERLRTVSEHTAAHVPGIHLEGPYFAPQQCGAQNTDFITAPKAEEYQPLLTRFGRWIRRWSYAPERDPDGAFLAALLEAGVLPAAGHTDATGEEMRTAHQRGCNLVTHLYSCTSGVTRVGGFRRTGVIETAFLQNDLYAEVIADGAHLPPDLLQMIVKIKGRERVALITDALSAAGREEKEGQLNGVPYLVEDGVCKLADRSAFAGSIATADRLLRTCVQKAGIPLEDSVYMAATVPAALLGLNCGQIASGRDADLIVLDENINVCAVYVNGKEVRL